MKVLLTTSLLLFFSLSIQAQRFPGFAILNNIGFVATIGEITDIYPMIIDENIFQETPYEDRSMTAYGGMLGIKICFNNSNFFFDADFSITGHSIPKNTLEGGHFYLVNNNGLEYRMIIDYQRTAFNLHPGYFFLGQKGGLFGAYVTAGISWGITNGSKIIYNSNDSQFDLGVQQSLRDGFTINNDFGFMFGGGIEFLLSGTSSIQLRYERILGTNDVINTEANSFFWREIPTNKANYHQLSIGLLAKFY